MAERLLGPARPSDDRRERALIGRRMELAWLRTRLEAACNGYPHLVILEGDPGIGKSRLALELIDEARQDEVAAYCGRCYENLALAYLPFQESLFGAVQEWASRTALHDDDVALLRRSASGVGASDPLAEGLDETERSRQLLGLTRVMLAFARSEPTIVFVDDLDWADEASIDLLRHLLFRFEDDSIPLLLLATSRADPAARAGAGVAKLRAERRCAVLALGPLPDVEATHVARQSGRDLSVTDARRLAHTAGGNPLFIEALVRERTSNGTASSMQGVGDPLVSSIRTRLMAMSTPARAFLTTSSIAPDLSPEEIAVVSDLSPEQFAEARQEAVAEGVIVDDGDQIAFVHPLYEHVAHRACEPSRRRAIHLAAAKSLRDRHDAGEPVSLRSIARHLQATRRDADPEMVAHYSRLAGNEALAIGAWDEAADHYDAALVADSEASDARARAALHRLAGLSRRANLELVEAVEHFDAAIEDLGTVVDQDTLTDLHMWRLRCGMATQQRVVDVVRDRGTLEALVSAIEESNAPLAASAMVDVSQSYWVDGRMDEAEAAGRRAMALAVECGNHEAEGRAATSLTVPLWFRYDLRESLTLLHEGAARAAMTADATTLAGGAQFRVPLVLAWLGHLDEARERALECCARADESNYPLEEGLPLAALALVALVRGDFDGAQHYAHRAALVQQLSGYHWASGLFLPVSFAADLARGRLGSALEALDTWAETADGLEQNTIEVFRRLTAAYERGFTVQGEALPSLPHAPMVGADAWTAAEVEVARREDSRVNLRRALDLLTEMERRGGVVVGGLGMLVSRVRGVAAGLLGDHDQAVATLHRALGVSDELDAGPERARTLADLARALMGRGDRTEAFTRYDQAIEAFDRLGMVVEAEQARRTAGDSSRTSRTRRTLPRTQASTTAAHAVVLFTDVVDSTRLTEEMGAVRYRKVARRLEDLIRSNFISCGGSVVSGINLGDGLIGLFSSLEHGMAAARRCAHDAPATGLHLHLGIDVGEIVVDEQRIYGTPVNFAARLCSLTGPDEILVSDRARRAASDLPSVEFVDRGSHRLKGIEGEQRVHALVDADESL